MRQFSATESSLEMMENAFYFTFLFRSQDVNIFLSWLFCHTENMVNKQLQYIYYTINQEVKAIRQWNFVS